MNAIDCGVPTLTYNNIGTNGIGIVNSPNYGSIGLSYLPDTECTYTLQMDTNLEAPTFFLVLKFLTSVFQIPGKIPNCETDYLEITNGVVDPKVYKYCGSEPPSPIYSHEGIIKVKIFAVSKSDGGKFRFEAFARSRDFGTVCPFQITYGSNGLVISPEYPHGYKNVSCVQRIHVGSQKNIDIYFFDIDLKNDGNKGTCSGGQQDYVEVRGTPYISTKFEDGNLIGARQCGNVQELYSLKNIRQDYVLIRFHSSSITNSSRGMYATYSLYDKPKSESDGDDDPLPLAWIGVICATLIIVIIVWIIIYKAINAKKERRVVIPATATDESELNTYPPKMIPAKRHSQRGGGNHLDISPSASPWVIKEPDYDPAELFAAKRVTLPEEFVDDARLSNTLFPSSKEYDLVSGLSPGYATSQYETHTAGVMTPQSR